MTVAEALDNLQAAYEAKDAAMARAIAEVYRQFAPVLLRRQTEYNLARRLDMCSTQSGTLPSNTGD